MSSFVNIDNKGKDILILCKAPSQGLKHMLAEEIQYSIDFTRSDITFCLSLYYNESNSFLFVKATKIYQFKARDSEIKKISLVFRKYFRGFFSNNIKKKQDYTDMCTIFLLIIGLLILVI